MADYDPNTRLFRSDVVRMIEMVESVIEAFYTAGAQERRAFASLTLFRDR